MFRLRSACGRSASPWALRSTSSSTTPGLASAQSPSTPSWPASARRALSSRNTSGDPQRAAFGALYRRVLRAHRQLPFHLRDLGDRYVQSEFRKHKAADSRWLAGFLTSWGEYAASIERQSAASGEGVGRALAPEQLRGLTDEQRNQLASLRYEAERAFKPGVSDDADAAGAVGGGAGFGVGSGSDGRGESA